MAFALPRLRSGSASPLTRGPRVTSGLPAERARAGDGRDRRVPAPVVGPLPAGQLPAELALWLRGPVQGHGHPLQRRRRQVSGQGGAGEV